MPQIIDVDSEEISEIWYNLKDNSSFLFSLSSNNQIIENLLNSSTDLLHQSIPAAALERQYNVDRAFTQWTKGRLMVFLHSHEAVQVHSVEARFEYSILALAIHKVVE